MARAALKQRGPLMIWFDPETVWLSAPNGKRGRSATFTAAAIQACLRVRARFGLPLRQATRLVASLLELAGLDWPVTYVSTLCRRQKGLPVAIPYRQSTVALHLLIDSTGIKAEGEGEWFAKKHGPSKPRQWHKVHLGIDAHSLEIRAIEVTGSHFGDAPVLPELLDQIPADQSIGKVTALSHGSQANRCRATDGAYITPGWHTAIAARSACAVIPARKNASPWLKTRQARRQGMRLSAPPAALAVPSGGAGADTTDEVWSRRRCGGSSCSVNASWRETSTGKWPSCPRYGAAPSRSVPARISLMRSSQ